MITVLLVLLVQVAALARLMSRRFGAPPAVAVVLVVSRLALPVACSRGIPAARSEGLGQVVAGTVSRGGLVVAIHAWTSWLVLGLALCPLAPLGVAGLFLRRCVRRLGGVTGDVLGACVEVTFTAALVVLTVF